MVKIKFYITKNRINSEGKAPVLVRVSNAGKSFRISTGQVLNPDKVDNNNLPDPLSDIKKKIEARFVLDGDINKSQIETLIQKKTKKTKSKPVLPSSYFYEVFDAYITSLEGKITHRGTPYSSNRIRQYNALIEQLKIFAEKLHFNVTFDSMDGEFYIQFQKWVIQIEGKKPNTFGAYIQRLKAFLKWAELEKDIQVNRRWRKFEKISHYVGVDFLTKDQLKKLYTAKLERPGHRIARDLFCFSCFTGFSISDIWELTYQHVKGEMIIKDRKKTGVPCYVPFYDDAYFKPREIAEKYKGVRGSYFFPTQRGKLNIYLKEIQKIVFEDDPLGFQLSTKIGRKTFATLKVFSFDVPKATVMQATGHRTEKAFDRYLGKDQDAILESFKRKSKFLKVV